MTELNERCFRNGFELSEELDRAIDLLESNKTTLNAMSEAADSIRYVAKWVELSGDCLPEKDLGQIADTLSVTLPSGPELQVSTTKYRTLDTLYAIRKALRTNYGLYRMDVSTAEMINTNPYTGDKI
jgi:hypothetical protein